jgi:hypothetical protein
MTIIIGRSKYFYSTCHNKINQQVCELTQPLIVNLFNACGPQLLTNLNVLSIGNLLLDIKYLKPFKKTLKRTI